jgi:hypothetical protein
VQPIRKRVRIVDDLEFSVQAGGGFLYQDRVPRNQLQGIRPANDVRKVNLIVRAFQGILGLRLGVQTVLFLHGSLQQAVQLARFRVLCRG